MTQPSIEEMIYQETEKRLAIMQQPDYEFPARVGKGDVAAIVTAIVVCLTLIVCCMTGVIV